MSKYIPDKQKHLTLDDRIYIQNELCKGTSFKDIALFLCKDPTTISKEVKAHRLSDWYHKGTFYNAKNFCVHRYHCKKTHVCGKIIRFQATFKGTVEFICALEFKISSQPILLLCIFPFFLSLNFH